jgi:hypothetical protein
MIAARRSSAWRNDWLFELVPTKNAKAAPGRFDRGWTPWLQRACSSHPVRYVGHQRHQAWHHHAAELERSLHRHRARMDGRARGSKWSIEFKWPFMRAPAGRMAFPPPGPNHRVPLCAGTHLSSYIPHHRALGPAHLSHLRTHHHPIIACLPPIDQAFWHGNAPVLR